MFQIEELKEYKEGKNVILAFERNVGDALKSAASIDYDDEGYILAESACILRRDLFSFKQPEFNGNCDQNCQENATPKSFQALVAMILTGKCSLSDDTNPYFKQSVNTISQLKFTSI